MSGISYANYNLDCKPKTILEFIHDRNYNINLETWFKDIWFPLFEKKNDILNFIHYGIKNPGGMAIPPENLNSNKRDLVKILRNNNIEYIEINHNNPLSLDYEYIKDEIKTLTSNNLVQKTWILLTVGVCL